MAGKESYDPKDKLKRLLTRRELLGLAAAAGAGVIAVGCSQPAPPAPTAAPKPAAAPPAAPTSVASAAAPAAPATKAAELPAIYKLLPKVSLSGVLDPNMSDRKDIPKAWPKKPKDPKKITIGWTEITLGNPWFVAVKTEAGNLANKYGFDLRFLVADSDLSKQSAQFDTFISQGVDIIVVDPTDVEGVVNDIKRAVAAGIPVLALGTVPGEAAPILTTITPNPYEVGFATGEYVGSQYKPDEEIKSALIIGVMGNSASEGRLDGMLGGIIAARQKAVNKFTTKEDAMLIGYNLFDNVKTTGKASYPDLKFSVLSWGVGNWTEEGGLSAAENILTAVGGQINIILPDNDFMGAGALKAIAAVNKTGQIKVACPADGDKDGLKLVKTGDLMCTGSFSGGQTGAVTMEFIKQIFIDGKDASDLPMGSFFPAIVFTKDNVDQYIDPDPNNTFYKVPPFEFPKSIPEIKASMSNQ